MEHINYFATLAEQKAAYETEELNIPQVDYCAETDIVNYNSKNTFYKKIGNVGDFYYANGMFSSDIDLTQDTPIGIVVIPRNFIPQSPKGRVMSLVNMSLSGFSGTTKEENMYPGLHGRSTSLTKYLYYAGHGTGTTVNVHNIGQYQQVFQPSDRWNDGEPQRVQSPDDPQAYYSGSGSTDYHGVSPYKVDEDGNITFNSNYGEEKISTGTVDYVLNAFSDFDGYGNTDVLVNSYVASDWKTIENLENSALNATSACVCKRFNCGGLDWYLPSCGELGFLAPRHKVLQSQLQKLIDANGTAALMPEQQYQTLPASTSDENYPNHYLYYWYGYNAMNFMDVYKRNTYAIPRAFALI
jgi:hypothetical protein